MSDDTRNSDQFQGSAQVAVQLTKLHERQKGIQARLDAHSKRSDKLFDAIEKMEERFITALEELPTMSALENAETKFDKAVKTMEVLTDKVDKVTRITGPIKWIGGIAGTALILFFVREILEKF